MTSVRILGLDLFYLGYLLFPEKRLTEIMEFSSEEVISVGEKTEHFFLMGYKQWHCELGVSSALLQTAPDS